MNKNILLLSIVSLILLSSCSGKVHEVTHVSFFPDYVAHPWSRDSFTMKTVKKEEVIKNLNFIDELDFKKVDKVSERLDSIWFLYADYNSMIELGLTIDNHIFYVYDDIIYASNLNNFTSIEIVDYFADHGVFIDTSFLIYCDALPDILF